MNQVRYRAEPMSREMIRERATMLRSSLGLQDAEWIDIVRIAEYIFPIAFEQFGFSFQIKDQDAMGCNHGLTNPSTGEVMIRCDVYERACRGSGRDRLTIAHELGHFLLHDGVTMGLARAGKNEYVKTYCDPEWQATAFAAELLMGYAVIKNMDENEVVKRCGVSRDAAHYQKNH